MSRIINTTTFIVIIILVTVVALYCRGEKVYESSIQESVKEVIHEVEESQTAIDAQSSMDCEADVISEIEKKVYLEIDSIKIATSKDLGCALAVHYGEQDEQYIVFLKKDSVNIIFSTIVHEVAHATHWYLMRTEPKYHGDLTDDFQNELFAYKNTELLTKIIIGMQIQGIYDGFQ